MNAASQVKAEIYDLIVAQDALKDQIKYLEEIKKHLIAELRGIENICSQRKTAASEEATA